MSVRRTATLLLAAALTFSLWGCTAGETGPTPSAWSEPTPSQQVQTLPFALAYDPTASLHPITSQSQVNLDLAGLVYEGLYELDRNFEPQPVLARSAAVSGDGLSWTITLDSGARFSDGTLVTAQHVADSLNTVRASALYGGRLSAVSEVTASESGAVVITLSSPNGALDALLDIPIVLEQGNGIPLGTGRYRFLRDRGELCLSINGNYRQALPYDTIPLREVRGAEERIAAFDSGEVTAVVTDFSSAYALGYSGTYEACDFPTTTLLYVGFRTSGGVCASARVRQAFSRAFDRASMTASLMAGHGDPACLPVSPLHGAYDQEAASALDYDAQAAGELLTQAGYELGADGVRRRGSSPLRVTIAVNNDSAFKQSLAEFLAQCLESLGVTVTVDAMPWESYQSALASGQFDLYIGEVRMTGDFDPGELLTGSLNYGGYASQTMTELLSAWRGARGAARDRAASALWQAFAREAPIAPLCFKRGSLLVRWGMVTGVQPTQADPFWNMEEWELAQ